ncbi:hypothetical protein SAMN05660841_03703 [Sphingobacterium nematocida]|uniref:DUF4136 domain-containing protein n=1 Tax=Sphingobacterium nematocida TaxID=1513896 RepID=A0A1T5G1J3_9SPHI|nr:hypothetical protein [Sphingobacterium nematocida]SKC02316.1 hypothetical protein SAMN05660841_03703 [Sphingobacterium nematocida]
MKTLCYQAFVTLLLFCQCASSSIITGSWTAPSVSNLKYKKVFVAALTENVPARQKVEDEIANSIQMLGTNTVKSIEVFPPDFNKLGSKRSDLALKRIAETNSDAILTIALLDKTSESRYVPNTTMYPVSRFGYYGTFGGYYDFWYGNYNDGYYTTDKTYYLEANLYDVKTHKLIWSTQSETYNPSSLDSFLKGYKKALIEQLKKDKILVI